MSTFFDSSVHFPLQNPRGYIRVYRNDGTGNLRDVTFEVGLETLDGLGGWMGLSFADFNSDGIIDIFATDFGNWGV